MSRGVCRQDNMQICWWTSYGDIIVKPQDSETSYKFIQHHVLIYFCVCLSKDKWSWLGVLRLRGTWVQPVSRLNYFPSAGNRYGTHTAGGLCYCICCHWFSHLFQKESQNLSALFHPDPHPVRHILFIDSVLLQNVNALMYSLFYSGT